MARKVASTKVTSGAGFPFEENVTAYYLACLLSGESPLGEDFGPPVRVDFQARVLGWLVDDAIITFQSGRRLALSIKSNEQITSRSFPSDFVRDCWELYLREGTQVWDGQRDYLGLATAPRSTDVNESLRELHQWARDQDEERFLAQVSAKGASSASKRSLFASLRCPDDLAKKYGVVEREAVRLLRRLRFPSFDFQNSPSEGEGEAVRRCRGTLRSGDLGEARDVWETLKRLSAQYRQSGGFIDLSRILNVLVKRFDLRPWPEYSHDVDALRHWTQHTVEAIPDKIGLTIRLDRAKDVAAVTAGLGESAFVALTGTSGGGKSVIAKQFADSLPDSVPVLWLDGKRLSLDGPLELRSTLGLRHPLSEVATSLSVGVAYCVVDGAGGISSEQGYLNFAGLVRALRIGDEGSPWRLLLVCQQEEWNRMVAELSRVVGRQIPWTKLNARTLAVDDLAEVWRAFPQLRSLAQRHDLHAILLRPKVLDLMATKVALRDAVDTADWVGESSVALWHWETEVAKVSAPIARSQAALSVAEYQADALAPGVSISTLPGGGQALDELVRDRVLSVQDNRVSFQHDLYGDWARLQVLLSNRERLPEFVDAKLLSPYWNRAVRLYGLYLLEQRGASAWKAELDRFNGESASGNLAQDLILESVIFAANPAPLLESLWPELQAGGGKLLRRLLGRFRYAATQPDTRRTALAKSPIEELQSATEDRIPYYPIWAPVISFLHSHKDDVVRLAPHLTADVANKWLRISPVGAPWRAETAVLALAVAEDALAHEWEYGFMSDDTQKLAFTAALAAINELPDAVRSLALRASGRMERPRGPDRDYDDEDSASRRQTVPSYIKRKRENVVPWSDGPLQRPNRHLHKVCFAGTALFPVIETDPNLAGEMLLALLIEPPREYDIEGDYTGAMSDAHKCRIDDDLHGHYPPFWWHLPWLAFVRKRPEQAIEAIVKLVNFASKCRQETYTEWYGKVPSVAFYRGNRKERWAGDVQCYFWYTGADGPHAVSSVLMTLEYWLYERLDAGEDMSLYLRQIMKESRSVAIAGMLASVACKHKELLKGPLRPLMAVPEFLYWEREKWTGRFAGTAGIAWSGQSAGAIRYFRDWHDMEHRKLGMDEAARQLFLAHAGTQKYFQHVRTNWGLLRDELRQQGDQGSADAVDRLISGFTLEHYKFEYSEQRSELVVTHEFPKELGDVEERAREGLAVVMARLHRNTFPTRCRQILDGDVSLASEENLDVFWANCQRIMNEPGPDDSRSIGRKDIACGASAVLLVLHGEWLQSRPDQLAWCREQILSTIEDPPPPVEFDTDVDAMTWHWHSFCAEAVPHIWVGALADQRVRRCVSLMALDRHYKTVSLLFRACGLLRDNLGDQLTKLQSLLRHWAREHSDLHKRENALNNNIILRPDSRRSYRAITRLDEDVSNYLLSDEFRQVVAAFVDDTLPAALPPLFDSNEVAEPIRRGKRENKYRRRRPRKALKSDARLIHAAYASLPPLDQARNGQERARWVELWQELLESLLFTLRSSVEDEANIEVNGTPHEADDWVLNSVAMLITQMSAPEHPERFWQPILDLGREAHYWVEHFLSAFFYENLHKTSDLWFRQTFLAVWREMILYCDKAPAQSQSWGQWERLMGLSQYVDLWEEQYLAVVDGMRDGYRLYCQNHLAGASALEKFSRFLCRPAARSIRLDGLTWIEPHLGDLDSYTSRQAKVEDGISLLLAECWQTHREDMRQAPATLGSFKRLVKYLADRQNPVALEIQNRIIAG